MRVKRSPVDSRSVVLPAPYVNAFAEPFGYLNFASIGPVSRRVKQENAAAFELLHAPAGEVVPAAVEVYEAGKRRLAALLGWEPDLVTVTPATSAGLFQAAFGLPGGNVVVPASEFPANVYPWLRAAGRGGPEVRLVDLPGGRLTPDAVAAAVDAATVAVSVSFVDFLTGFRADLAALREAAGDALLVVDAIHGLGAVATPAGVADVVVGAGQKWLRAGWGAGFIAVSERARDRLAPTLVGWYGVEGFLDTDAPPPHPPRGDAERYHMGSPPLFGAVALGAAASVIEEAGIAAIETAVLERACQLEDVVRAAGAEVLAPWRSDRERSGILSFRLPGEAPALTGDRLRAAGLVLSARGSWVRLSPHATTPPEVAELLADAL